MVDPYENAEDRKLANASQEMQADLETAEEAAGQAVTPEEPNAEEPQAEEAQATEPEATEVQADEAKAVEPETPEVQAEEPEADEPESQEPEEPQEETLPITEPLEGLDLPVDDALPDTNLDDDLEDYSQLLGDGAVQADTMDGAVSLLADEPAKALEYVLPEPPGTSITPYAQLPADLTTLTAQTDTWDVTAQPSDKDGCTIRMESRPGVWDSTAGKLVQFWRAYTFDSAGKMVSWTAETKTEIAFGPCS